MRLSAPRILGPVVAALALSACFGRSSPSVTAVPIRGIAAESLRTLPVVPAAPESTATVEAPKGITVTANDADARSLLIAIAREAGISMVISSDVRRRVSVSLTNASPSEAIAAIIAQAGLTVEPGTRQAPVVVFYQLLVNVNEAPAETIALRYGVSDELATWVIQSRPTKPVKP